MSAAHTPGPWRFNTILTASENHRGWNIVCDHKFNGGFVGTVSPKIKEERGNASAEGLANARLIAAAPELLEALQGLLNALPSATSHPAIKAARATIAKAIGEQA